MNNPTDLPRLNREEHAYLNPVGEAFYPLDPAEFRRLYADNPYPEFRREGLAAMSDDEVTNLARTLQLAVIEDANKIAEVWHIVCWLGQRVTEGGQA